MTWNKKIFGKFSSVDVVRETLMEFGVPIEVSPPASLLDSLASVSVPPCHCPSCPPILHALLLYPRSPYISSHLARHVASHVG